MSFAEISVP